MKSDDPAERLQRQTPTALGPVIIPVAGGKGGVGKSLFTANLAIALARLGEPTVAVDLDLGGSNLHTFLGLSNDHPGIGDFLVAREGELPDLLVDTGVPGLRFLPGDGRTPFMANIPFAQKSRLIQSLQSLQARYVLLDLGGGSSFNTLDFFGLAPRGLVITTPELPALMNLLSFLKNLVLRVIAREIARSEPAKEILEAARTAPMRAPAPTVEEMLGQIASLDPEVGQAVAQACRALRPRLVFNMGESAEEIEVARHLETNLAQKLSLELDCFGFVCHDPMVRESIRRRIPLLEAFPESLAARGIGRIAERLVRLWAQPIPDSRERLLADTRQTLAQWQGSAEGE